MTDSALGPDEQPNPFMPLVAVPTPARTHGVSPKLWAAIVSAAVTYLLGQTLLELPPVAVVAGQTLLVALAVWRAAPGDVTPAG